MRTVHLQIKGKVQGVYYRASAKKKAKELGIGGWVRNDESGDVEAIATASDEVLKLFIEWCKNGPSGAIVREVIVTDTEKTETLTDFQIRK